MKIFEIGDIVQHPAVQAKAEFAKLLQSDDMDEVTAFIMDDRNAKARRLDMLRHLDELLGEPQESYTEADLEDFMHDQGPSDWRMELKRHLDKFKDVDHPWSKSKGPYEFGYTDDLSDEEAEQIARDLKLPPYHLTPVEEDDAKDVKAAIHPHTGEYELCGNCLGDGCHYCGNEGLIDVTGEYELPKFD